MIELKVVQDQRTRTVVNKLRAFIEKGTVVFVCFDDKEWTFANAGRHTEVFRNTTNQKTGRQAGMLKDPRYHAGGGGFAMGAGDTDHPPGGKQVV